MNQGRGPPKGKVRVDELKEYCGGTGVISYSRVC